MILTIGDEHTTTSGAIRIKPLFDWHELMLSGNFVRWTKREAITWQLFEWMNCSKVGMKQKCRVKVVDRKSDDLRMVIDVPVHGDVLPDLTWSGTFHYNEVMDKRWKD